MRFLTDRQQDLFDFVKRAHGDQKRKYTGHPYYDHPLQVAHLVHYQDPYGRRMMVEAALLHDVLEDTDVPPRDIVFRLNSIGYSTSQSIRIMELVEELTDKYTKEAFPELNRKERKRLEAIRMGTISPEAQTVKYCDIIDNAVDIAKHDPDFAKVYKSEMTKVLQVMDHGDPYMFSLACDIVHNMTADIDWDLISHNP